MNATRGTYAALAAALLATTAITTSATASHFRGGALVSTIDGNGLLTVTATTFWRPAAPDGVFSISDNLGGLTLNEINRVEDTSDTRFTRIVETYTGQIPTGFTGLISLSTSSCCRVGGIANAAESSWDLEAAINYTGVATAPILFDFSAIQPEVVRGANYNDNLGAISGSGQTLSYNQNLNLSITSQPSPGFVINTTTGALFIPAASTAAMTHDNTISVGAAGADYAFSGNILASDGSFVEFDWLFDAVDTGGTNQAPDVNDAVINALVGSTVNHTVTGSDPDGDPLIWDLVSFFAPGGVGAPTFDPLTQQLVWDTTGANIGDTLIANVRASDGSLTDTGTITINIVGPGTSVPEPGAIALLGGGLLGFAGLWRNRRRKRD